MNIKKLIKPAVVSLFVVSGMMTSCSDFLDKMPDNRVTLDTPKKVRNLLVSAYMDANYALIGELSSDNLIDNTSPDKNGVSYPLLGAEERMHEELFAWEDVKSSDQQDSPSSVWGGAYLAIAVANHALDALDQMSNDYPIAEINALRGEALISRAFHHFVLVNIFSKAYRDEELSKQDVGIPYITEPEKEVFVNYERISVTEVYKMIEQDILEGLPLLNDEAFTTPKYHFNEKAAYSFAARFYLFKRDYDKVIEYADAVLGQDPSGLLRSWKEELPTFDAVKNEWASSELATNSMLMASKSNFFRVFGSKYGCNRDAADGTLFGKGPTWSQYNFHPCYSGRLYIRGSQDYGLFYPKGGEFFEYTDKVAGIGYPRVVRSEFSAEETLLCRAEAYIMKNNLEAGLKDLQYWDDSRKETPKSTKADFEVLTMDLVKSFYTPDATLFVKPLNASLMSPSFIVTPEQEPFIHCVLHFRRLQTIFDGMRWLDIKRFGIEIQHNIGASTQDILRWDDPRRAIQIPQEVIAAGFEPNIRYETADNGSGLVKFEGSYVETVKE